MEFGIQLKKSGIPLTIVIQIPSSTDKDWNPVPGIQNPRLFWIPLSEIQLKRFCATFHTLPLFYLRTYVLRTYALKNYATVEIHNPLQGVLKVGESRFPGSNQIPYPVTFLDFSVPYVGQIPDHGNTLPDLVRSFAQNILPPYRRKYFWSLVPSSRKGMNGEKVRFPSACCSLICYAIRALSSVFEG